MRTDQPVIIRRNEYRPPAYLADRVELSFDLEPDVTTVTATLQLKRNPVSDLPEELVLHGEELDLVSVEINGRPTRDWTATNDRLVVRHVPQAFTLRTVVRIRPMDNTTLSGLYVSKGNFYTQCEAEGFRRITYFPDRPDVMAIYRVRIEADKLRYPVLLSNGNLVEQGHLDGPQTGRHYALWEDPFPKPSYLFALVAGDLVCEEQRIRTRSGAEALLQVWVEPGNLDKTHHAMESLIKSIRWDEERFGLELDLGRFMIVAVGDFNMGAMENKGLNIFNTKYVLAHPQVATDADYLDIESVVAHEYFHNWTGNRVTCRDWFQLSLKEGLTVFRDQEFTMDMLEASAREHGADPASARAVKRIDDVRTLRAMQFPEDAGPMAHPIRPDEYQEINNFYTVTVYEKGAEVVRMLQTIVGRDGFRRGMDEYFRRHDGQAVTCDDFLAAMEAANKVDLAQFRRWYSQAGTPHVKVKRHYDPSRRSFTIELSQRTAPTNGQLNKQPFHIPVAIGLLGPDGHALPLRLQGEDQAHGTTRVLSLNEARQSWTFVDIDVPPVPSVLRGFSAPVVLEMELTPDESAFLMAHDDDPFCRWEAGQRLLLDLMLTHLDAGTVPHKAPEALIDAFRHTLHAGLDPAFVEIALSMPSMAYVAEQVSVVDPDAIARVHQAMTIAIARALRDDFRAAYDRLRLFGPYSPDAASAGKRALRNLALRYLVELGDSDGLAIARAQFQMADNMTDRFAALSCLANVGAARDELTEFFARYENEPLVIDKWFALQASSKRVPDGAKRPFIEHLVGLLKHAAFNLKNPNRARSVILQFCMNNLEHFHAKEGFGYELWAEYVLKLDRLNPQVAARLARALDRWRRYTPDRQARMRAALERVAGADGLSNDTYEVVSKALA
ncbi:MAG TPA: aminopeptidase N [Burkholderiaceae bacterium]|nr:aminopeptidase N [Burkholderiaceae bacterium]